MKMDWKRNPIWQQIGVVLAAMAILTEVVLAPPEKQLPLPLIFITGFMMIPCLLFFGNPARKEVREGEVANQKTSGLARQPTSEVDYPSYPLRVFPQKTGSLSMRNLTVSVLFPIGLVGAFVSILFYYWNSSWYFALASSLWMKFIVIGIFVVSVIMSIMQMVHARKRSRDRGYASSYEPLASSYQPPIDLHGPTPDAYQQPFTASYEPYQSYEPPPGSYQPYDEPSPRPYQPPHNPMDQVSRYQSVFGNDHQRLEVVATVSSVSGFVEFIYDTSLRNRPISAKETIAIW